MPSGTAVKPGDVVTAYGGKTIEILNTDAEGRLVLADALGWVAQYNPKGVVDLATLTGAVITCLGHIAAGAMSTDQELMSKVKSAAVKTHERVWELPLWDDYDEGVKSKVADVQNIGDGTAGTIAGAAFLKKFAEGYPWVHLDIAGTAWGMKNSTYIPEGASGYGVRLLVQLVEDW
jgi:leucyl aminopeptidase